MNKQIKKEQIEYKPNSGPVVILIHPQIGENIGATARAMLNCGLMDLRLVSPRDGWPDERAYATCSGANLVLDNLKVFTTTKEAVADLHYVLATTARHRDMQKEVFTPQEAAINLIQQENLTQKTGLLFGCERSGLSNEDIALSDAIISAPLNPNFSSLNLAQAVLIITYQWYQEKHKETPLEINLSPLATKENLLNMFDHLEEELDHAGFFKTKGIKPTMIQNIRNIFHKAKLSDQEVRTLHGIIVALTGRKRKKNG